jgi:hypothetical protein
MSHHERSEFDMAGFDEAGLLEFVDLRGKNEVTLGEAINFVGPNADFGLAPRKQDVWMMPLRFRNLPDLIYEGESLPEVRESKRTNDVMSFHNFPFRHLLGQIFQFFSRNRGNPAPAWYAGLAR